MNINNYFSANNDRLRVSREQASHFAKAVAGDFNPIHDPDSKRFCVPGDLLFSLTLHLHGISNKMNFNFAGMVSDDDSLHFAGDHSQLSLQDEQGKEFLRVGRDGARRHDTAQIESLAREYVRFSGHTFPHLLVPLMQQHGVMLHPERPMVIYESMEINLQNLDFNEPRLEHSHSMLQVNGKRGRAVLDFNIIAADGVVGTGRKNLLLSGLLEFEATQVEQLVDKYELRKSHYLASA